MKLGDFKLLADENIHPQVIQFLRTVGFDVSAVAELNLMGTPDLDLLRLAYAESRVVVTHDSDFGTLAVLAGEPIVGIVYLRPGHINPQFTIETIRAVLAVGRELSPPFILVAQRKGTHVTIRLRTP